MQAVDERYIPLDERPRPEDPEILDIRTLLTEHDDLFEDCMTMPLRAIDQKRLDELIEILMIKEQEYWDDVSGEIFELVMSHGEVDFPTLRFLAGHMPALKV